MLAQPFNQAVIWDRIVKREQDAKINISNLKNKYMFKEIGDSFKLVRRLGRPRFPPSPLIVSLSQHSEANVTFSLQYNVMPYVGLVSLLYRSTARSSEC